MFGVKFIALPEYSNVNLYRIILINRIIKMLSSSNTFFIIFLFCSRLNFFTIKGEPRILKISDPTHRVELII